MRMFRVYNRVRKVGVTWPVAGLDFGLMSMIILLSVGAVFVTMAAIGSMIAGPPAAIVAGIVGVIGILTTIVVIARLLSMGRLNEGTQLRLIVTALHRRRHRNFATPDVAPQRDGAHRSFPDANTVYRNF